MYKFIYSNKDHTTDSLNSNSVEVSYCINSYDLTLNDMVEHFENWLRSVGFSPHLETKMIDITERS